MNETFAAFGIAGWKPWLTALALPPVPLLLLVLAGARLLFWRRAVGWLVIVAGCAAIWLSSTVAAADWLAARLLVQPPPLVAAEQLRARQDTLRKRTAAVIVLGGGREALAPEYGMSNLGATSIQRLRYGVWLGRELGAPVGFSGGVGHGGGDGATEAEVAARIAARELARPLRWVETQSRDTRENAAHTLALLKPEGIAVVFLVTHAWHMPRAVRAFREAAQRGGTAVEIVPAPMGWAEHRGQPWLPSGEGLAMVRRVLREAFARLAGA